MVSSISAVCTLDIIAPVEVSVLPINTAGITGAPVSGRLGDKVERNDPGDSSPVDGVIKFRAEECSVPPQRIIFISPPARVGSFRYVGVAVAL